MTTVPIPPLVMPGSATPPVASPRLAARPLTEFFRVRVPRVLLVSPDPLWTRVAVTRAMAAATFDVARPVIDWTRTDGWRGPGHLLASSGLTQAALGAGERVVDRLEQMTTLLTTWARKEAERLAERKEPEPCAVAEAALVVYDCDTEFDDPHIIRALLDLGEAVRPFGATLVLPVRAPLAPTHPLRQACVEALLAVEPEARYGALVDDRLASLFPDGTRAAERPALLAQLVGCTQAEAEAALLLATWDVLLHGGPAQDPRPFADVLASVLVPRDAAS